MPTLKLRDPLQDGRQSETALKIRRGVGRMLRQRGFACLPEMALASGRRADLVGIGAKGEIWVVEVKSSIADFRADQKWPEYRQHCDRFYFATAPEVPADIFPLEAGLIMSDGYGAEIMRDAKEHRLAGATRKSVTLRIAQSASYRLQDLLDPDSARLSQF